MQKTYLTWEDIELMVGILANQAKHSKSTKILSVARGGLIPAVMLSHLLGIKKVEVIQAEYYEGQTRTKKLKLGPMPKFEPGDSVLVVDEICDTGDTLDAIDLRLRDIPDISVKTAVLIRKPDSRIIPDYIARAYTENKWFVFPWEIR